MSCSGEGFSERSIGHHQPTLNSSFSNKFEARVWPCALTQLLDWPTLLVCPQVPGHERQDKHRKGETVSSLDISLRMSRASLCLFSSNQQCPNTSGGLLVWVALQLMEFNTVQLLEPLLTELTGEVVVGLRSVFLHVPVQGRALATLVATDFTSD